MDTTTSASGATSPGIELDVSPAVGYESPDEIDASKYQVAWANVMAEGQYLTPSEYQKVEVLMLCWARDSSDFDSQDIQEEVSRLESVLKEGFRYNVKTVFLDAKAEKRLQVHLNAEVAGFIHAHDGPNTLLMVYYAGHGKPGEYFGHLELLGQTSPNDPRDAKQRARNRVVWNETEHLLRHAESDVLEIFDCCHAGTVGLVRGENRLFEFLAAAGSQGTTKVPGPESFTSALSFALESLRKEKPESRFTTTELLRKIKEDAPNFPKDQEPIVSDRDPEHKHQSAGRIMLHPLRSDPKEKEKPPKDTSMDQCKVHVVTLHYEFGDGKPSVEQVITLGRRFNDLFERNALGVHRIRWGGIKRSTLGLVVRRLSRSLRRRRASGKGRPLLHTRYGGARSLPGVVTKSMELLSPQAAEFESLESIGAESPRSILPSSAPTSDMDGEPELTALNIRKSHKLVEKVFENNAPCPCKDDVHCDQHMGSV